MSVRYFKPCPICGESDMVWEQDGEDTCMKGCANLSCGSNGGNNFSGVAIDLMLDQISEWYKHTEWFRDWLHQDC